MRRALAAMIAWAALAILQPGMSAAAELVGSIKLPANFKSADLFDYPGYWKVPNEVMELRPRAVDPRMEMVVVLRGSGLSPRSSVKPVLRMEDARFIPSVLPVRANQKITLQNADGVLHILEPAQGDFIKARRIDAGTSSTIAIEKPGAYTLRCSEVPHMVATIFVAESPRATLPNRSGQFSFDDVPSGAYTLRVWYGGDWIYTEPVAVRGRTRVEVELKQSAAPPSGATAPEAQKD